MASEYGDSQEEFRIGNVSTTPSFREFSFHIPRAKLDAVAYEWGTTQVADGKHVVEHFLNLNLIGSKIIQSIKRLNMCFIQVIL